MTRSLRSITLLMIFLSTCCAACGPTFPSAYQPYTRTVEEVQWDTHHEAEKAGRLEDAARGYAEMCAAIPPCQRACYDRVRLSFSLGDINRAQIETLRFIRTYPDNPLTQPAIKHLVHSYIETNDLATGMSQLSSIATEIKGTQSADSVRFALSRLYRISGNIEGEKRELTTIVNKDRWGSRLYDDAIFRLIKIAEEEKNAKEEERLIVKMIGTRESSYLIGSYHSGFHDSALLRLGDLLLEEGRTRDAFNAYKQLSSWKTSRLRDDALLKMAHVQMAENNVDDACTLLNRILKDMPDSGSCRIARTLIAKWKCAFR